jgi:plastocyanin
MRRTSLSVLVLVALVGSGALAVPALSAKSKTIPVKIGESPHFFFVKPSPAVPSVTIHKGDRIRWQWCPDTHGCSADHNVVGSLSGKVKFKHPRDALSSGGVTSGTYTKLFTTPGTYRVTCTIHGFAMKVRVKTS